jgi:serine/threonine protein kinase
MAAPATTAEFIDLLRKSGVSDEKRLEAHLQKIQAAGPFPQEPAKLAGMLVRDGLLTHFQAEQILQGKWRRFTIGKYKVLERLGSGGMGSVYLCEHKLMRRRVAVKVLPTAKAQDPSSLERFYREARAVAALDHPNIVHAYDIDQDENLHFLVMEYVDGASLQEMVKRNGAMNSLRAAHYMRQAALGLQHAHNAGLVHRDIKPGNILVDRTGVVKILDMGLARFFNDEEDILTKKYDENVLGTADYLAPEQALDSHGVDIRADIYSLGATFYFVLSGRTPFGEGTVAQKLIWHQTRAPKPIRSFRQDVPQEFAAVIEKMMSKDPAQRYQNPSAIADALIGLTQKPIDPPPAVEMPRLSLAAVGPGTGEMNVSAPSAATSSGGATSPGPRKSWQVPPGTSKEPPAGPTPRSEAPVAPPPRDLKILATAAATSNLPPTTVPAKNNGRAAVIAAPVESPAEELVRWETMTNETEEMAVQADTPSSRRSRPSSRKLPLGVTLIESEERDSRRLRIIGMVVGIVLVLAVICGFLLLWKSPTPPPPRGPLYVSKQAGHFLSIREALKNAQAEDRIVLLDPVHKESLQLGKVDPRVTIMAAEGKRVVWSAAGKAQELLFLSETKGLRLQGIKFDGKNQVKTLIAISGYCEGLTLENLVLEGFQDNGIKILNCAGKTGNPVTLRQVKVASTQKTGVGLRFATGEGEPKKNAHILIEDCDFHAPPSPIIYLPLPGDDIRFRNTQPQVNE